MRRGRSRHRIGAICAIALLAALTLPLAGRAGPLDDAQDAYKRGDYETAYRLLQPLAERGDSAAETDLGFLYANGQGVQRNYAEAVRLYRLAADRGYGPAQRNLGWMYADGHGVGRSYIEAAHWFKLAADQGDDEAQNDLGTMYEKGLGVAQNYREAMRLYRLSADQGNPAARASLARLESAAGSPNPAAPARTAPASAPIQSASSSGVRLEKHGGVFLVPVLINDAVTLKCIVDSGSADVSVPANVVMKLFRSGTLTSGDFLGKNTYKLADGTTIPSETFRLRSIKVGDRVLINVVGSVGSANSEALLGQSFLSRFKSWHIDNQRQVLVLE